MPNSTSWLDRLELDFPLLQAPMAGMATPELAAEVSNAGALGGLGAGSSSVAKAREMICQTRQLTRKPFNINFFCHQPAQQDPQRESAWLQHLAPLFAEFDAQVPTELVCRYPSFVENPAMLDMLLEERPAVVSFIFGVPPHAWIKKLQAAGIGLIGCATTLDEAMLVQQAGLDAVVAQGMEAGGHRGVFDPHSGDRELGLMPLLRLIKKHCSIPVIGAGGIMDGAMIRAAMANGAAAVQMGTAFILAPESAAKKAHRQALLDKHAELTALTDVISGRPARGIVNRWQREIAHSGKSAGLPDYPIAYDAAKQLAQAASACGHDSFSPQWAGQGAPLARAMPARELIAVLAKEAGWLDKTP